MNRRLLSRLKDYAFSLRPSLAQKKRYPKWVKKGFSFLSKVKKKITRVSKALGTLVIKKKNKLLKGMRPLGLRALAYIARVNPKLHKNLLQTAEQYRRFKTEAKLAINMKVSGSIQRTPTFLQMEATECGSICFSIILAHYGYELTAEEARSACGVSRDGSKASHIVRAARQYNMNAKGYSVQDIADLDKCTLPAIIHWNFDHFVVYEGREGDYFFINDPAAGRRRVTYQEFNQNFTGIILVLTPNEDFVKRKQENPVLQFLTLSLKGGINGILAAFFLSILQVLPTLVIAFSGKVFIDYILVKNMPQWLIQLTLILTVCVILQSVLMVLHQRLLVRLSMHFKLSLESLIVHKLFYLPLRFFDQRFNGDVLYRLAAAEELSNLLSLEIMGALSNMFGVIIFTIVLSLLSPQMFVIMLGFIALRIMIFYTFRSSIRETNIHYQQQFGKVSGVEMNGLDLMDTLKANNLEHIFFKNWAANHDTLLNKHQRVLLVDQRTSIWLLSLAGLMTVALLYRGTYLVMGEEITIGTLMAFIILGSYLDTPVMTLLDFSTKIEKIKASIQRFNDILLHEGSKTIENPLKALGPGSFIDKTELPPLSSGIILRDVSFGYAPLDPPIFENLNLILPRGSTIALVGVSGSGKSTISKIICGLYPIFEGAILWDSKEIQDLTVEQRNKRISLVDQDIYLFDGTVRENLTSWDKNIDDDILIESLKVVGLYEELLPRGLLNSRVGENGSNLSGGQRQRLEIARAVIRKADLLILDEATSSLDVPNESHVFESLGKLNITTLIIAHRLSTIQNSDHVYVISEGQVNQSGTPRKLGEEAGIFKDLMELEMA